MRENFVFDALRGEKVDLMVGGYRFEGFLHELGIYRDTEFATVNTGGRISQQVPTSQSTVLDMKMEVSRMLQPPQLGGTPGFTSHPMPAIPGGDWEWAQLLVMCPIAVLEEEMEKRGKLTNIDIELTQK